MNETTYLERAGAMNAIAITAEIPELNKLFGSICDDAKRVKCGAISGVNIMREAGLKLQSMCGHEVMTHGFWLRHCKDKLDFDYETAKHFMGVARRANKPVLTLEEASEYMQPLLITAGEIEPAQRAVAQLRGTVPPLQIFCLKIVNLLKPLQKIFNAKKMEEWDKEDVRLFLSETEWVESERLKAKGILNK